MKPYLAPAPRVPAAICRYGDSRLAFRGPRRRLTGDYLLFLGSTDTYGKFIEQPYPALLERVLGLPCINMACVNAGIDAFRKDRTVWEAAHSARAVVLQVLGAHNLSNRFYTVHPRRNDRFLRASTVLQRLYPEIDFADYSFTRHLLGELRATDPHRFTIVEEELRAAWTARTKTLIEEIGRPVILFWFSDQEPLDGAVDPDDLPGAEPLFITREMIETVRPATRTVVELSPSRRVMAGDTDGMVFDPSDEPMARQLLGVGAHRQAAAILTGPLRRVLAGHEGRTTEPRRAEAGP
ncbi:MAG: hypothetical protein CSA72_13000 [Rhodobacterales bacterium]|nr:MAG: hypothetical protein CSA72_13000 [Rhodobacterales bacterium]